ncbi:hypothetical protein [Riemerella anatipestifer]|uniref:Uncharacterized protein n=3 Tax=Riemerella anatipestifer TaxID=34085 RepID=J9QSU9_RIEAN|nr:hypothetical protein [Riemerella anatipestifer]ADQ82526.1 hypothetical protein Riean_1369 [Riemerella anatipestifer ATCC 11845 = DSM 15868]ADZ11979.1 hypothetical protein RIA_0844 [Riemerella anatipestifer RA-GD]AFD56534.1 hypothetical protein RA0C_1647 [Riemerella anatipestifer ATCC 11845 = DSM 15868]AFR35111.1 hypothetical protein B739_0507 [Riemerella anatipestifer RA-CH-1]AGC39537.1 hypothetical protein G148_0232 [Riemerella anatipestifer RA-CH-2]
MDKIKFLGLTVFLVISGAMKAQMKFSDKKVEVYINLNWTKDSLDFAKEKLKSKNITFNFSNVKYNPNGTIKGLEIDVNSNDGFSGKASIEEITRNTKFGFLRNYSRFSQNKLRVGAF